MTSGKTRGFLGALFALSTVLLIGLTTIVHAAPLTPGNIVVANIATSQPTIGGPPPPNPTPITLTEYTSAGGFVQSYTIPTANGQAEATAFVGGPQINFGNASNQLVYVGTAFTNTPSPTGFTSGYVVVNFAGGSPVISGSGTGLAASTVGVRGTCPVDCRVYTSYNPAMDRFLEPLNTVANYMPAGNNRLIEAFNGNLYLSSGSANPGVGINLVSTTTADPPPTTSLLFATSGQPLGFAFADANTCYLTQSTTPLGVFKYINTGSWTSQGGNTTIGGGSTPSNYDLDISVNGGNVSVYVVQDSIVYRIDDTLASTGATWTGATTTPIVTIPTPKRGKSIAVVPGAFAPAQAAVNTSVAPAASGSVAKSPNQALYNKCDVVQLTATPASGFVFVNWTGTVATSSANPYNIIVDSAPAAESITANFAPSAGNSLLTVSGVGNGQVDVSPPGSTLIFPGGPYNISQPTNTAIHLDAFPDSNWVFDHWSGSLAPAPPNDTISGLDIVLSANGTLVANFKQIFQVRTFTTGNGQNQITGGDPFETNPSTGVYTYRSGSNIQFTATPNTVGSPANPWTFTRHHDAQLNTLSTNASYTYTNLSAALDDTAEFSETPNTATPQAFTAGNIVLGTVKDFFSPGQIEFREYNTAGQLVQPPVIVPTTGVPSATTDLATSTVAFDINFDPVNPGRLYAAATTIDQLNPGRVGFVRTVFSGGSFQFDLRKGLNAGLQSGRGTAANGDDVYYSFDTGIHRYNIPGDTDSNLTFDTPRMLEVFNNDIYVSTSATSTAGDFAPGAGIYRIDTPTTSPTFVKVIGIPDPPPVPPAQPPSILAFKFASATTCYVCTTFGQGFSNINKFYFTAGSWVYQGSNTVLSNNFGRGVDVTVNGNDVRVYINSTTATSEGLLSYIDDKLDNSLVWSSLNPVTLVPRVSRGRAVAIVPGSVVPVCSTCRGDMNGDNKTDGADIQKFVQCFIGGSVGAPGCACSDMAGPGDVPPADGTLTAADITQFVNKILRRGGWTTSPACQAP